MASKILSAPIFASLCSASPAVLCKSKFIFSTINTGPASNFSSIFIMEIPVKESCAMTDLCIGAAPLHFGKTDA